MMKHRLVPILASLLLFQAITLWAQPKKVTYEMAFNHSEPQFYKSDERFLGWKDESYFYWKTKAEDAESGISENRFYLVHAKNGKRELLTTEEVPVGFRKGFSDQTSDYKKIVWIEEGDLFFEGLNGTRQLTFSKGEEKNPRFSPDAKKVAYTRDNNLFTIELSTGVEKQLTQDGTETVKNGYASWVYFEEIYGRPLTYRAFWWSPDSAHIAYMRFDDSAVDLFQIYHIGGVNGYWESTRYPKAGRTNPYVTLGVVSLETRETRFMNIHGDNNSYLAWPIWHPSSGKLWVQWMNRDQDRIIVYEGDPESGQLVERYTETQKTWVEFFSDLTFLKDGSFLVRSNKNGFAHIFRYNAEGVLIKTLTHGDWRVEKIHAVDEKKGEIYFNANMGDSLSTKLMVVGLDGTAQRILTPEAGRHKVYMGPSQKYFVQSFSTANSPSVMSVHSTKTVEKSTLLYDSRNQDATEYRKAKIEFFTINTEDGYALPAYWALPTDFDTSGKTKYPVIFRIYSGPDVPTVKNRFNSRNPWREHFFADLGVITISVDHRGSGHFGKKGMDGMHRNLGVWELSDLITAVKWLRQKPFVDPDRMGIIGYSYGGYMTLLAMTQGAEYFTHGIAGAPVTDWIYYDSVYTERYMDTPEQNPDGYKKASILSSADLLSGKVLLFHGTTDDNVHFQQSLELVDRWTAQDKDFLFMAYPESRHGVKQRKHMARMQYEFWTNHFGLETIQDVSE